MVKILAVGDFHGEFPKKFEKIIKKEKIDFVISNGDYETFSLRNLFFKHVYANEDPSVQLWDFVGKKKVKEMSLKDRRNGESVLKKLNKLSVPVFTVFGNNDYHLADDVYDEKVNRENFWKWINIHRKNFPDLLKKYKNLKRVDYTFARFNDFVIIGARGHSFPGRVKSKAYKKHKAKLEKLFKKFSKENKAGKVIFVSHNVPYDTKLDRVTAKDAHDLARGKHFGSKLVRRIIDKYHPVVYFGGHIDEGRGKQKMGRTLAVNCGPAHEGYGVVVEINDKGKVKYKEIK